MSKIEQKPVRVELYRNAVPGYWSWRVVDHLANPSGGPPVLLFGDQREENYHLVAQYAETRAIQNGWQVDHITIDLRNRLEAIREDAQHP